MANNSSGTSTDLPSRCFVCSADPHHPPLDELIGSKLANVLAAATAECFQFQKSVKTLPFRIALSYPFKKRVNVLFGRNRLPHFVSLRFANRFPRVVRHITQISELFPQRGQLPEIEGKGGGPPFVFLCTVSLASLVRSG